MRCLLLGFANDLTFATKKASSKPKPESIDGEQNFSDDNSIHGSPMKANGKQENSANGDYTVEDYAHSEEDLARSPHDSLAGRSTLESPSQVFSNADFGKGSEADAETHRYFVLFLSPGCVSGGGVDLSIPIFLFLNAWL